MTLVLLLVMAAGVVGASTPSGEVALANVTRFATGDLFALVSSDCGMTRCMEESHGTALPLGGEGCVCQCGQDTPAFREDQGTCVGHIDECVMASFGRGATKPQIPLVFLPLKGQIMYPSKEIVFTVVDAAVCAVTSAQYLSPSGWVTLRDLLDNDVPFGLYRDEGSTFLQWRGSTALHSRLEGRLVAVHVLCSAPTPTRLAASCAAFRVAGASHNIDVRSIPFHAGEIVTAEPATQSQGLSVLESLAIGVCVLMLVFVYAAGIVFYVHYKKRQKRKEKDPEMNFSSTMSTDNGSTLDSRIGLDSMRMKTNPLMKLDGDFLNDAAGLSDVSERTEETMDSYSSQKFQKMNPNVVSAMVHNSRPKKKPARPSVRATSTTERMTVRLQRRSASPDTFERAPHSDLSIVDYREENLGNQQPQSNGEPAVRKKLYFNPVFFETEHLKDPPPAALEFLVKIREIMSIAKEKMTSKRFIPILSDIPEEELYHTIDLGWDIPCARRGRRFSAISLKRENSRRAVHCGGCPGCDSSEREQKAVTLARSNSCKTCVSDDYKQKIVRKWLDDVPLPPNSTKAIKPVAVAKVSGTPRVSESKTVELPRQSPEPIRIEVPKPIKITSTTLKEALHSIPHVHLESQSRKEARRGSDQKKSNKGDNALEDSTKEEPKTKAPTMVTLDKRSPSNHATRRVRKRLPPPPPPPDMLPLIPKDEVEPVAPEVKAKMRAVIQELNQCRRAEPIVLDDMKIETIAPIAPKIVIPVLAADSHYFSDDNVLETRRREQFVDFDSLERHNLLKKRRFSLACGPEMCFRDITPHQSNISTAKQRLSQSWRDVRKAVENYQVSSANSVNSEYGNRSLPVSEVFINTMEPLYNNLPKLGPLTIQVRGSPVENRRNTNEDFDPDTLDRKPRREVKKRIDKILLKSGGSFKHKFTEVDSTGSKSPDDAFTRKIGSLREIYEAKTKVQDDSLRLSFYERRGSVPYGSEEVSRFVAALKTPDLIRQVSMQQDVRPPVPPKQRRGADLSPKFSTPTRQSPPGERRKALEERDRFSAYSRAENLNARRSGRRLPRTRSRRTDLRKLYKTEDSGYMSTDSNESKRRARYLLQLRPKSAVPEHTMMPSITVTNKTPPLQIESDTDDLESLCDGRSESGGESVETDSVFFGNFDESKQMLAELGMYSYEGQKRMQSQEQIDSGFMGETNIILSGDSDSEHRSVISIIAGRDGRASAASIAQLDDPPYVHSVEC